MANDIESLRKKAEQGDAEAQERLGSIYYEGMGIEKDCSEAVKWWEKSAEQGNADAQFYLGKYLYDDTEYQETGISWIKKAAKQGVMLAHVFLKLNNIHCDI